ncbi:isoprenylcysteine carboxyl methyltransferase family protein [Alkalibacillus aidingensis]|uniref:isoprenylcysteine carboxyl methyltransferase family protein n=1 Tax=Alkalibacillus aidingensis TaxID=2747607 RepID=UPI001660864B|nr:isoprenylcysteine carboxylmethyltransferase family protein [Alkalibacillus aidingensis]
MIYMLIIIYLISLRLLELMIAKSNARYQVERGGVEIKESYYPLIVLTHILFLISLISESYLSHGFETPFSITFFLIFVTLQLLRIWVILSLGRAWNTKVIVNPNEGLLVRNGLYRYIKHPNYWIVFLELVFIPLLFSAYWTAMVFPVLHVLLMLKRIPVENEALRRYLS